MTTQQNLAPNENAQGLENLKTLKSVTLKNAAAFREQIYSARQKIDGINRELSAKQREFDDTESEHLASVMQAEEAKLREQKQQQEPQSKQTPPVAAVPQESVEKAAVQPQPETLPPQQVASVPQTPVISQAEDAKKEPKSAAPQVRQPAHNQPQKQSAPPTAQDAHSALPKTAKPQPQKPAQPSTQPQAASANKPHPQSDAAAQNLAPGVKTYTDEKGNVKVRKFLETPKPQPTPPIQRQYGQQPRPDQRRSAGQYPQQGASGYQSRTPGSAPTGAPRYQGSNYQGNNYNPQGRPGLPPRPGFGAPRPYDKKDDSTRPGSPRPAGLGAKKGPQAAPPISQSQKTFGNKNKTHEKSDDKRALNKKNLLIKNYAGMMDDEDAKRYARRPRSSRKDEKAAAPVVIMKIERATVNMQNIPMKLLSEKIGVSVPEIIKQLFKEGIIKTINDSVEFEYASYIAGLFDVTLELKLDKTAEEIITEIGTADNYPDEFKRPPIVTVMGHVDHGKTSLLDAIRNTNVTSGEAGGITQHIGAYTVYINNEQITFIDTPGHAAFTAMRARGAKVTDVAIIVVAADDGVMPQTLEAISHAKAAEVSILVAINKMDKPDINLDRVKQQLSDAGLLAEDWGGDTIMVPVSAKTGFGLSSLLESVLLVSEIKQLQANPEKTASGTVIEAKLDKGRGPVSTILVRNGTLHVGDNIIAGMITGKVRAMFDDKGKKVLEAGPSCPVEILGFSEVPNAGDYVYVADEKLVRKVAEERKNKAKIETARLAPALTMGDLFGKIKEGELKTLNLIIKTDVIGSLEALKLSLSKISNEEVKVAPIHGGVGAINETDIMLARASNAIIIGFNVRADSNARSVAEHEGVDIRLYNIIYDAIDDVTKAMKGLLTPKFKESIIGQATVREVFKITGVGAVAGSYVTEGKILRQSRVRVYRNDVVVHDGKILALKRFKDDAREVVSGFECGISLENFNDIKAEDIFECYIMEEIEQ